MTVSSSTNRADFAGNGSTDTFAVPFRFLDNDDLTVLLKVNSTGVETVQMISSQYAVTGAGAASGGSLTMVTPPASGETLTILLEVEATQETDFVDNDALPAAAIETALDKLTMLAQRALATTGRAILVPKTDSASLSTTLPAAVTRASKYFGFNASGEPAALDPPTVDTSALVVVSDAEPAAVEGRMWIDTSVAGTLTISVCDDADYNDLGSFDTATGAFTVSLADEIVTLAKMAEAAKTKSFTIACSDEGTPITAGTAKVTLRLPFAFTLTGVRASLSTPQTSGNIFTVDINEDGATILSTKLTIDNTEDSSEDAATAAVISDSALADDAEITIDVDQIGDGTAKGLKVSLIGYPT